MALSAEQARHTENVFHIARERGPPLSPRNLHRAFRFDSFARNKISFHVGHVGAI